MLSFDVNIKNEKKLHKNWQKKRKISDFMNIYTEAGQTLRRELQKEMGRH